MVSRVALFLGLVCLGLSCGSGEQFVGVVPCSGGTGAQGGSGGGGGTTPALVGTEVTVPLMLVRFVCGQTLPVLTGVDTTVYGPDNLPIEHTHSQPATTSSGVYEVDVKLTPTQPGNYHLSAVFQPSLGVVQADIFVARDFTQVTPDLTVLSPIASNCSHFGLTRDRAVICQSGATVRVLRDEAQVNSLVAQGFAVDQDRVWVLQNTLVTRWRDTGSGPLVEELPQLQYTGTGQPVLVLPGPDDVWVADTQQVSRWQQAPDAGAFVKLETHVLNNTSPGFTNQVIGARNANGLTLAYDHGVCAGRGDGGVKCERVEGSLPMGATPHGLWTNAQDGVTATLYAPGSVASVMTMRAPQFTAWRAQQGAWPVSGAYSMVFDGTAPVLAKWPDEVFEQLDGWAVVRSGSAMGFLKVP